jgi:hypothetical protein
MAVIVQIEFNYYEKRRKIIDLNIRDDSGGGPTKTGFKMGTPEAMYEELYDFLENTLNKALKSENEEAIDVSKLDKDKIVKYFKALLDLIEKIEDTKLMKGMEEYLKLVPKLKGFSVYL